MRVLIIAAIVLALMGCKASKASRYVQPSEVGPLGNTFHWWWLDGGPDGEGYQPPDPQPTVVPEVGLRGA